MKACRLQLEVSHDGYLRLMAEARRRQQNEDRGNKKYAIWRIVDELLRSLPPPDTSEESDTRNFPPAQPGASPAARAADRPMSTT